MTRLGGETGDEFLHDSESWPAGLPARPGRRRAGAFVVVVSMLLGLGVLGWAGEVRYHIVARLAGKAAAPVSKTDPRVASLLSEGERALRDGDLERAQSDLDKASVLTERDSRVLVDQARVAVAKADVTWLRVRLLPASAAVEMRLARAQLDEAATVARRSATEAMSAAPDDAVAQRAVLDALRIEGEMDAARMYVVAVFASASQPETAYALAALDLAQASPPWGVVVDRLRLAAAGEAGAGRARAALVYALVRSGDAAGARAELAKLDALPRPYPLLPELHAFLLQGAVVAAASSTAAVDPAPSVSAAPSGLAGSAAAAASSPRDARTAPPEGVGDPGENYRGALQEAAEALARRDLDRAERIYQGILASSPNDSQAVAGLGDVARHRGDSAGAISAYRRAIAINPSYLPALLGLADVEWTRGDQPGASRVYKDVVSRFPEGTYPAYAAGRAAGAR